MLESDSKTNAVIVTILGLLYSYQIGIIINKNGSIKIYLI